MKYNPDKHHRRSLRLKGYDYSSAGAYFITICTFQRHCLFGQVVNGEMQISEFGSIATECWQAIPEHFPHIELGGYIVMPNHVHGILVAEDPRRGIAVQSPYTSVFGKMSSGSIPTVVRSYKSATTKRINTLRDAAGTPVWQRNYYDHIIRDERSLQHMRHYITNNPVSWADDQLHPCNPSKW